MAAKPEVRAQAQAMSQEALRVLLQVATESSSDAARVSAANAILDRAQGKPRQGVDMAGNIKTVVRKIERVVVDPDHRDA